MKIVVNGTIILEYKSVASDIVQHSAYVIVEGDESERASQVAAEYKEAIKELRKEETCQ